MSTYRCPSCGWNNNPSIDDNIVICACCLYEYPSQKPNRRRSNRRPGAPCKVHDLGIDDNIWECTCDSSNKE